MRNDVVSIVIPTYNRANLIPQCVETIISQTYKNWECIIVDDFSTDNTGEIVKELARVDRRIKYCLNERSKGAQGARNTGILQSTGNLIAFLDSDDEWLYDKLENQLNAWAGAGYHPYTVVHGDCIIHNHQTGTKVNWNLPTISGERPYKSLLKQPSPLFQSMLTSKQALLEVGLLDEQVPSYQEWDTALKLSRICSFIHLAQPLFTYHLYNSESIFRNPKKDIEGYHYILTKYRDDIIANYGNQFFMNTLVGNIKRIIDRQEWDFGISLLKESKKFLRLKTFLYYTTCFRFRINPDRLRKAGYSA